MVFVSVPLPRSSRYVLRTTDVVAAASFYDAVLGGRSRDVTQLPHAALERGARPHWLGHIGVRDVGGTEAVARRFAERGAVQLGPTSPAGDIALRTPGGAVLALTNSNEGPDAGVVWHQLSTRERDVAAANYAELFGWSFTEERDLGNLGRHRYFAFGKDEPTVGAFSDVESRPRVHTHWLFFFAVPSLDVAVERVLSLGGAALGPMNLPDSTRVAACDDPQGAAFGLLEYAQTAGRS